MPKPKVIEQKMVRLVVPLTLKVNDNTAERTFEGFAATWDQDLGNDVIKKGAFKESLSTWKKSGEALPLLDSHDQWSITSALGQMVDAQETTKGLWTKWEVLDGPEGDAVLTRLRPSKITKRPLIGKMSIGFLPMEFGFEQPKGTTEFWDRIRHITKADLKEVSLVLFPMNPNASIDASTVKSFLLSAENTDAAQLDVLTKKELRKLAGTIGSLLKKQKDIDDDVDDAVEEKIETPKGKKHTPPPAPSTKTDLEDVDEDDEELDDTLEDPDPAIDDAVDDDTGEDTSEESDDADEEEKSTNTKNKKDDAVIPIYQFGEALTQRIAKLNLNQRVEDLTGK